MKTAPLCGSCMALAGLFLSVPTGAGELITAVLDGGGGSVAGGTVQMEGSFGGLAGVSEGAPLITSRAGFPAQIYDPLTLMVIPGSATVLEFEKTSFAAHFLCDDDSLLPAVADMWSISSALATVSSGGEVMVGELPGDVIATLTASSGVYQGTAELLLQDSDPDNYGPWAGDGIPDDWQEQYFSGQEANGAAAADPDADGQDNQMEYLAGTDPRDPASVLVLRFEPDPAPGMKLFVFTPFLPDRSYSLERSTLEEAVWTGLPAAPVSGAEPGEGLFTDAERTGVRFFYRLRVTVP